VAKRWREEWGPSKPDLSAIDPPEEREAEVGRVAGRDERHVGCSSPLLPGGGMQGAGVVTARGPENMNY
jgi:hypothetical protein